jgi:hypothetical protein
MTDQALVMFGGELSRAHPAVIPNIIDGLGRGLFVLGVGALLFSLMPQPLRAIALRIGRTSLVVYVFHIPFCYGRLGSPLLLNLDMGQATLFVLALMLASYATVLAKNALYTRAN